MAANGMTTDDLDDVLEAVHVIVNAQLADGTFDTAKMPVADLATQMQMEALNPGLAAALASLQVSIDRLEEAAETVISFGAKTYTGLTAIAGTRFGQIARSTEATGTHADPITGNVVPNGGDFIWVDGSPDAWSYFRPLRSDTVATPAAVKAGTNNTDTVTPLGDKAALDARVNPVEMSVRSHNRDLAIATTARTGMRPYTLNPKTVAWAAACTAVGATPSANRQNRHSRMMDIFDREGITAENSPCLVTLGSTAAQSLINHFMPGIKDSTTVGSPAFDAGVGQKASYARGWSAATTGDWIDTHFTAAELGDDVALWVDISNSVPSAGPDMGDYDAACVLWTANSGFLSKPVARMGGGVVSVQQSAANPLYAAWNGAGVHSARRVAGEGVVRFSHHGVRLEAITSAATGFVATGNTIRVLQAARASGVTRSQNTARWWGITRGLTERQERFYTAAVNDWLAGVMFGDMMIYDVGVGPQTVTVDVAYYGLSWASCIAAYKAASLGLSVALFGDPFDETKWDVGGMLTGGGLYNIDCSDPNNNTGLDRETRRWVNTVFYARADDSTQVNLSPEGRAFLACLGRMFDPNRTGGLLPGLDIKIYMTGGITGVQKSGTVGRMFTTRDGRTIYAKQLGAGDYDGDMPYLAGVPCIIGRGPVGLGAGDVELFSGYRGNAGLTPTFADNGTEVIIGSYRDDGVSSSGLHRTLSSPMGIAINGPDPVLQAMNIRLTVNSSWQRYVPWADYKPDNYDPANYELVGRYYAGYATAQGSTIPLVNVWRPYQLAGNTRDANGVGILSLDAPNSGEMYAAAGQNIEARRGVNEFIYNWEMGLIYWHLFSGDSRIPANVVAGMQAYTLDAAHHLDPGTFGRLYIPNLRYRREPHYKPQNTGPLGSGVAILNGNDFKHTDGTAPRNNGTVKTIAVITYSWDSKYLRLMDNGAGRVYKYNSLSDTIVGFLPGGPNGKTPWPLEISLPDKSVLTNMVFLTTPSITSVAWSPARMEPFLGQAAEFLACVQYLAIKNNCAVQDVDYATARAMVTTGSPYTYPPSLPQVN